MKVISLVSLLSSVLSLRWIKNKETNKWIKVNNNEWLVGSNFIPSNSINELEMFQKESFDLNKINIELGYANSLGFNSMRVFLHNLLWENDSKTFLNILEQFLEVSEKNNIKIMFVLLDSCWNAYPKLGKQPDPIPYVHNSQWVQAPGIDIVNDPEQFALLKDYIYGVVSHFRNDERIIAW